MPLLLFFPDAGSVVYKVNLEGKNENRHENLKKKEKHSKRNLIL